jgi:CspA family cold shock protein
MPVGPFRPRRETEQLSPASSSLLVFGIASAYVWRATAFHSLNAELYLTIRTRRLAGATTPSNRCVLPRRSSMRLASGTGVTMAIGTVKFFNAGKGFGFVAPEGGGKDVFVHASAVEAAGMRVLSEGQRISFDTQPDAKGSKAVNLKPA